MTTDIDPDTKAHYCIRRDTVGDVAILTCHCGYIGISDNEYSSHPEKLQPIGHWEQIDKGGKRFVGRIPSFHEQIELTKAEAVSKYKEFLLQQLALQQSPEVITGTIYDSRRDTWEEGWNTRGRAIETLIKESN